MRTLKSLFTSNKKSATLLPQGEKGIKKMGHRNYVGGHWDEIGLLQFKFLTKNGLRPEDVILDIACGSLRAGVHLIPYLNKGNYLGMDKEEKLIELGLEKELGEKWIRLKEPSFVVSENFEFQKFQKKPNFAIAQSLFTHLPPKLIHTCFRNLRENFDENGAFFATYFISPNRTTNPEEAHSHGIFYYTVEEAKNFGTTNGWEVEVIGDWRHPRNQQIFKYSPKKM